MANRLTKIYTRKGDEGYTSLRDAIISKDDLLVEALGTVDELNSCIGMVIALGIRDEKIRLLMQQLQNELFDFGAELHVPERISITAEKINHLEKVLDQLNADLPHLKEFLLPGGTPAAAACHVARTVCRRAERALVRLHRQVSLDNTEQLRYLNRLSDLLFVIARILAREDSAQELQWQHN